VTEGSLSLDSSLRGEHLHIVSALWDPKWFDEPVGNADPALQTGFNVRLLKLLADRAGFTYTIHSVPLSAFSPELSWSEYLDVSLDKFDLNLDTWLATEERAKQGMATPLALWDMSLVSMVRAASVEPGMWNRAVCFSAPLSGQLLCAFALASIAARLFCSAFERDRATGAWSEDASRVHKVAPSDRIGFSSHARARHSVPSTPDGKMRSLTYGLFILLLFSVCTAKLAVSLVQEHSVETCASFDACLGRGRRVCIKEGTAVDTWLTRGYAHLDAIGRVVRTQGPAESGLITGRCDVAVGNLVDYRFALQDHKLNPHCSLHRTVEDPLQMLSGGWMTKSSYNETCSYVLRDGLRAHLLGLTDDGQIYTLMEDLYRSEATQDVCSTGAAASRSTGAAATGKRRGLQGLPADSMLGALAVYGLGLVAALALHARRAAEERDPPGGTGLPLAATRCEDAHLAAEPASIGSSRDRISDLQWQPESLQGLPAGLMPLPEASLSGAREPSRHLPEDCFPEGGSFGASEPRMLHRRSSSASFR
jgi:hypothetical protein